MAITGGFGMTMDLERGTTRQWVMGRDGVKRWADNDEPVAEPCKEIWLVLDEEGQPIYCAGWPHACHEHINDAINEHDLKEAAKWKVRRAELVPNDQT